MKICRYLIFLSIIAMISPLLISCSSKDSAVDKDMFDELIKDIQQSSEEDGEENKEAEQQESKAGRLVIIIPARCGADIYDSAAFLSEVLSNFVEYEVKIEYDTDVKSSKDKFEIIIGQTSREASLSLFEKLRYDDKSYCSGDGALVVGAREDSECASLVIDIANKLLTGELSVSDLDGLSYFESGEYTFDKIKLNGFELGEYSIVYPSSSKGIEEELAYRLCDMIREKSGYCLDVVSDKKLSASGRGICIGKTLFSENQEVSANTARLSLTQRAHIELSSDSEYGFSIALDKFCSLLFEDNGSKKSECYINSDLIFPYDDSDISVFLVRGDKGTLGLSGVVDLSTEIYYSSSIAVFYGLDDYYKTHMGYNIGYIFTLNDEVSVHIDPTRFFYDTDDIVYGNGILRLKFLRMSDSKLVELAIRLDNDAVVPDGYTELTEGCEIYATEALHFELSAVESTNVIWETVKFKIH